MGGCRCSYKNCKSATKTMENLHFFHYPVKHRERCAVWIKNAEKPQFLNLPDDQLRNKVICGLHFKDKYFANMNKKRLVHDAIPTKDDGCLEEVFVKEVEVLPTSVDGTTFTLQTLQAGPSRNIENKFGFRNGKVIVHKFDDSESEVYTIDPLYIHEPFYNPNNNKTIFLNSTSHHSDSNESSVIVKQEDNHPLFQEESSTEQQEKNGDGKDKEQYLFSDDEYIQVDETTTDESVPTENPAPNQAQASKRRRVSSTDVLRRINIHSREIANIKSSLDRNRVKQSKSEIIRMLRGKIPNTLLGAVSLNLFHRSSNLTSEERAFLDAAYSVSPSAYKTFEEFGWFLPKQISNDHGISNGDVTVKL